MNIELIVLCWFIGFIIHQKFNISYRIKRLFKIKITTEIKVLDCYPCFAFWIALAISFNIYIAISVYLISIFYDKINRNN